MDPLHAEPAADAGATAAAVARESYGRLLAWLAWQWRDIAAAEDALGEAFARALTRWPLDGVPESPQGWLLAVAKNHLLSVARRQRLADDPTLTVLWPGENEPAPEETAVPDDRLRLMFVCTHPAIERSVRPALMLQTVLGQDAARIAAAFLVSPEAMSKRLTRAKAKIKTAGIRFEEPGRDELPARVASVLEAIYGAYVLHWGQLPERGGELAQEALFLAELVAAQLHGQPEEAEALGLLSLLQACEARVPARLDAHGEFVPLDRQDPGLWDAQLLAQANRALTRAASHGRPGPFQLEAAIQSAHGHRALAGHTPWAEIVVLYQRLLDLAPTIGAQIGHAMALAHAQSAESALPLLTELAEAHGDAVLQHQPWWAARAHLLAMAGRGGEAAEAYGRALALTADPALRRYLEARRQALPGLWR